MGYFLCPTKVVEWIIAAVATVLLFFPGLLPWFVDLFSSGKATGSDDWLKLTADLIGIGLWALIYGMQKVRIKADPSLTLPIHERQEMKEAAA